MGADASSSNEEAHITCDKLIGAFSTATVHTKPPTRESVQAAGSEEAQITRRHGAGAEAPLPHATALRGPAPPTRSSLAQRRTGQSTLWG